MHKGTCHRAGQPEFNPWDPPGGSREPTLACCYYSAHMYYGICMCTHTNIYIYTNRCPVVGTPSINSI